MANVDLEKQLLEGPDEVNNALEAFRRAELERERLEAKLFLRFKAENPKKTADEIKAMVKDDESRYQIYMKEILAEVEYNRLNDRLLSAKKLASLRTAF